MISSRTAQQIVDTVHDICQKNINFFNTKGIIIASTDPSRLNTFHEVAYQSIQKQTTMEVYADNQFPGARKGINIPIYHNRQIVAAIGISGEVGSARKYAHLAQKITSILLRERDLGILENQKKDRMSYIIRSLIHGKILEPALLDRFLSENSLTKEQLCRVLLVQTVSFDDPETASSKDTNTFSPSSSSLQNEIFQAFREAGSDLYTYSYPNIYILLIKNIQLERAFSVMQKFSENAFQNMVISIGSSVPLLSLKTSYETARLAIQTRSPDQGLIIYDNLGYELLLSNIAESARKHFLQKTLSALGADERALLKTYYAQDMSLQKTCESLHIHKNTLQYQLNRIHHLCGYNPRRFKDAVILYSALMLFSQ